VNSNTAIGDVYMYDSANTWICTEYGSIYHNNPAKAFDSTLRPFLDKDTIVSCKSVSNQFKITNYNTYTNVDTVRAYLKKGSTVLQTLTISNTGIVTFTAPSSTDAYYIEVVVTNPTHPQGLVSMIPVKVENAQTPSFRYSVNR